MIVTSNSNDFSEVFESSVSGYMIDSFDVSDYVSIINKIIEDKMKLSRVAMTCIKLENKFT
jgi:DNA-binding NarL/FixJ family response regulator